jgi:(p)ppGpp synthase/HD superfamily hydrolase
MHLTKRYDWALAYASDLHRKQLRKGTAIPYISHLLAVSALVLENGGDEDQAIAGLLHDAAEDQGGKRVLAEIESLFGPSVRAIVADCTDAWVKPKPPWRPRKEAYIARLEEKPPRSLLVSLADKAHNSTAIRADLHRVGPELWQRFNGGKEGTIWYYETLSEVFQRKYRGILSDQLRDTVAAFPR